MTPQQVRDKIVDEQFEHIHIIISKSDEIDTVLEALEKQIPEKPFLRKTKAVGYHSDDVHLDCPRCDNQIVNVWSSAEYKPKYCHYCGQALDWNDIR